MQIKASKSNLIKEEKGGNEKLPEKGTKIPSAPERKFVNSNNFFKLVSLLQMIAVTLFVVHGDNSHQLNDNLNRADNNLNFKTTSQSVRKKGNHFNSTSDGDSSILEIRNLNLQANQVIRAKQGKLNSTINGRDSMLESATGSHMLLFDDLNDDEDEEEDDETDGDESGAGSGDNFYRGSPSEFKSSLADDSKDLGADIEVSSTDFKDFDDHEALKTKNFYRDDKHLEEAERNGEGGNGTGQNQSSIDAIPAPVEDQGSSKDRYKGEATDQGEAVQEVGGDRVGECAIILTRGLCLTYAMIEWATRRARRVLNFRRPRDLQSTEISERSVHLVGELLEMTTRFLAQRYQLNFYEINVELNQIDMRRTSLWAVCPSIYRQAPACLMLSRFRTHTGVCNNLNAPFLGSSFMPFQRMLPAHYADGIGLPRRATFSGRELPPARLLALYLHPDIENLSPELSGLYMSWGQLVNHDLAMASGARVATGHSGACCREQPLGRDRICMPIQVGLNDPVYSPYNVRCLDFKRSLAAIRPGCSLGPRLQLNTITTFIDASFVYGSRRTVSAALRRNSRGLLNVWDYFQEVNLKPLLPAQTVNPDEECVGRRNGLYCFQSGDPRTNQQIQLVTLHTLHMRQHNRLAQALRLLNPHWTDQRLYHEARHIHVALIQHFILTEYLPILLGPKLMKKYNLEESPMDEYWDQYDPTMNPSVSQAFAAAAFRQGHTTIPGEVFRFNNLHQPIQAYKLRQFFRQPWLLFQPNAIDEFVLGMLNVPSESFDPFLSVDVSGHLFQGPNQQVGLDLTAINIQRGRDQGLAGYLAFRDWCGLSKVETFADLVGIMDNRTVFLLESFYETIDDVDLFTGGISEYPLSGAQVGETFACIIGRQFQKLRAGDRFWFENSQGYQAFTLNQLNSIKSVSLARLLCINSDSIITIQQSAFQLPHPVYNPLVHCNELPDLDITQWTEYAANVPNLDQAGE